MTEAYRCDDCHEYFDGLPYATYNLCFLMHGQCTWQNGVISRQVCETCFDAFCKKNNMLEKTMEELKKNALHAKEIHR